LIYPCKENHDLSAILFAKMLSGHYICPLIKSKNDEEVTLPIVAFMVLHTHSPAMAAWLLIELIELLWKRRN